MGRTSDNVMIFQLMFGEPTWEKLHYIFYVIAIRSKEKMSRQSNHGEQCMHHAHGKSVCVCDSRNTRFVHKFSLFLAFPVILFLFLLSTAECTAEMGEYTKALIAQFHF